MDSITSFPDLNEVLNQFNAGVRRELGPGLVGMYLQGSFAAGDADEGSDVDFMVVTQELLTKSQEEAVQRLQRTIYDLPSPWAQHLEGSYFPADLLRRPDPARTPVPFFNHGSRDLEYSSHDNSLVVRCIMREYGVALYGPPARELIDPVPQDDLRKEVRATLHTFGAAQLADTDGLDNGWRQPYVALSIARMLHTIDSGAVYSKRAVVDLSTPT